MKRSVKLVLLSVIIGIAIHIPAIALDTTETFSVGAFTEFEAYASIGYGTEGIDGGMNFLVGGGIVEQLCYFITAGTYAVGSDVEIGGPGIGFVWTPVNLEKFSFDIIPSFSFDPNTRDKHLNYTAFNAFTTGLTLEFNCMALKSFQPYLLAGFEGSYDYRSEDDFGYAFPLAIGAMVPIKEKIEFLMQLGWSHSVDEPLERPELGFAVGVNGMATDELEVISEAGYEISEKEFHVMLGLIYAI